MKLQKLKEEARIEFEIKWKETMQYSDDYGDRDEKGNSANSIKDFINSQIDKAYKEGKSSKNELLEIHKKNMEIGEDYQREECNQCKLEGNTGICDRKDCKNHYK